VSASAGEKTEQATPKRQEEARKKGQVARSMDLNGAVVLLTGLGVLALTAPLVLGRLTGAMHHGLTLIATPDVVGRRGVGALLAQAGEDVAVAVAPLAVACLLAGVAISVAQVGWKPSATAVKPDPKKLNPLTGAKNLFGKRAAFELAKTIAKVAVVGAIVGAVVVPELDDLAALVGMPAPALAARLAQDVLAVALRATAAYLVIAVADLAWQRHTHEKGLRMTKEEVKQEMKGQNLPPEVRSALRRRQMTAARGRMMADVPQADVVVTNPTHYAVALRYGPDAPAPVVVAKGMDVLALKIRAVAADSGVPVVPDPPLARSLHGSVEVGQTIPEELYQAVAHLLAYVYRTASRRAPA
jgi:flagellar biosynthetic protein FlhB